MADLINQEANISLTQSETVILDVAKTQLVISLMSIAETTTFKLVVNDETRYYVVEAGNERLVRCYSLGSIHAKSNHASNGRCRVEFIAEILGHV